MPWVITTDRSSLHLTKTRTAGQGTVQNHFWGRSGTTPVTMQTLMGFIVGGQMVLSLLLVWNGTSGRVIITLWRPSAWRSVLCSNSAGQTQQNISCWSLFFPLSCNSRESLTFRVSRRCKYFRRAVRVWVSCCLQVEWNDGQRPVWADVVNLYESSCNEHVPPLEVSAVSLGPLSACVCFLEDPDSTLSHTVSGCYC